MRAYARLLERYADLPEGEDLILLDLAQQFGDDVVEEMLQGEGELGDFSSDEEELDELEPNFDNDLPDPFDELADEEQEEWLHLPENQWNGKDDEAGARNSSDEYDAMQRVDRHFRRLLALHGQITRSWCNVLALGVPAEQKENAFRVLIILSRVGMNLSSSEEALWSLRPDALIALGKRMLADLNEALATVLKIKSECKDVSKGLKVIAERLLAAIDDATDFICNCRDFPKNDDNEMPF